MVKLNSKNHFLLAVLVLLSHFAAAPANAIQTSAREAIVMDFHTGTVLFSKNPDQLMAPASMSKIMTIYLLFQQIKEGKLSLDDTFIVSENAWRRGGEASGSSTMFLLPGKRVRVEDLIRGIIVQSGNDACIVVAENISESEDAFAEIMTAKAVELGMVNTVFQNSTGWPNPDHVTTARELGMLAIELIRKFPEFYHYFLERKFSYNNIVQSNRNPLLNKYPGADGLKTGHTNAAGYGLTASAVRAEQRLLVVINGLKSKKERASESAKLLDWGFRHYKNYLLFKANEEVETAKLWLGVTETVPLVIEKSLILTLPRMNRKSMKVKVSYNGPIPAPVKKGDQIASLLIEVPENTSISIPLLAGASVEKLGVIGRLRQTIKFLLWGN